MQLSNFQIIEQRFGIEIDALGEVWNLHDAYYLGLHHSFAYNKRDFVTSNEVELSWQVDPARYSAKGFSLVFHEVTYFEVTPRDEVMPLNEDTCLDSVGRILQTDETNELKARRAISTASSHTENYHLSFRFHGGQTVRIESQSAEFVKRKS